MIGWEVKKVKYNNKSLLLSIMILILVTMSIGCNGSIPIPIIPVINPNPSVNPGNSTLSYIEVTASSSTIKINQSQQFVVKGYNSDDEWVILDKSKIKSWDWSVVGQCYNDIVNFVNLSPKSASLTTTFSSGKAATFYIVAYYQENIGEGYITDYRQIKVVN